MQVRVKYHDIIHQTEKAILFLVSDREVWLPRRAIRALPSGQLALSEELACEKGLNFKPFIHVPTPMVARREEVLPELRYDP